MSRPARIPGTRRGGVLYVLPSIPDELDPELKNALAPRNACMVEGRCPSCGAEPDLYRDAELEGVFRAVFRHDPDCGALTDEAA